MPRQSGRPFRKKRNSFSGWRALTILLVLLPLILLFQNCGQDIGTIVTSKQNQNSKESGNSTGYGGKLVGNYYHYVPEFACEGKSEPMEKLELTQHPGLPISATLWSSSYAKCEASKNTIDFTTIDTSEKQTRVVGYEDRIFEAAKDADLTIPDSLIEIWCVDQWKNPSFEILSEYDPKSKTTKTEVNNNTLGNVSRLVNQSQVQIRTNSMNLVISKKVTGTKFGTYVGTYDDQNESRKLDCRLGGYLDARIWPAKLLGTSTSKQIQWSTFHNRLYFINDNNPVGLEATFMAWDPSVLNPAPILGGDANTTGVSGFTLTPDHQHAVISAQLSGDVASQLYRYHLTDRQLTMLNTPLILKDQSVDIDLTVSSDGSKVFYRDGAQEPLPGDVEHWLRMVPLFNPGMVTQINHDLPLGGDIAVYDYSISESLNKVVYTVWDSGNSVWILDLNTNQRTKLLQTAQKTDKYYSSYLAKKNGHFLLADDRYIALILLDATSPLGQGKLAIYDLVDGSLKLEKLVNRWSTIQLTKNSSVIFVDDSQGTASFIVDLNKMMTSPVDSKPIVKNNAIFLNSDLATTCGNVESFYSAVDLNQSNDILILRSSNLASALSIWRYTPNTGACKLVNSLLLADVHLAGGLHNLQATLSPGTHPVIALRFSGKSAINTKVVQHGLFIIPEGGQSPIEILHGIVPYSLVSNLGFTSSGRELFFQSSSMILSGFSAGTFVWRLPAELEVH